MTAAATGPRVAAVARRHGLLLAAAGILLAFFGLRLALVTRFPPFTDEALYADWTWRGFEDSGRRFVSLATGKEPLLPWLGMAWMAVGFSPLTAVRLVSLAAGLLTLVATGLIAYRLSGRRVTGLVAAALCAVLPFFVVHDVIGIYDGLATALVASALLLEIELARRPRLDYGLLLGLVFAAAVLTKATTYIALALTPASLLVFDWNRSGLAARLARWVGCVVVALALGYVGYSVMSVSDLWDDFLAARSDEAYPTHSLSEALRDPGRWIERTWPEYRAAFAGYLTLPLVLACAVGAGLGLRRTPRMAALLGLWALAALGAATLLVDVPFPRYLLVALPPLVAFAALGLVESLAWIRARLGPPWGVRVAAALAVVALLPALVLDARVLVGPGSAPYPSLDESQYVTSWAAGQPWKPLAGEIERRAGTRPLVVLLGEQQPNVLPVLLRNDPQIQLVRADDPLAAGALLAVENGVPVPPREGGVVWRKVWRYDRPHGGTEAALYEAHVELDGTVYRSPDALRAGLALPDAEFDALLASRPELLQWYRAWYEQRGGGS